MISVFFHFTKGCPFSGPAYLERDHLNAVRTHPYFSKGFSPSLLFRGETERFPLKLEPLFFFLSLLLSTNPLRQRSPLPLLPFLRSKSRSSDKLATILRDHHESLTLLGLLVRLVPWAYFSHETICFLNSAASSGEIHDPFSFFSSPFFL